MAQIFIIGVRGIPNRYGGFERLVEVLAPHLVRQGHEVTVFCEGSRDRATQIPDNLWHGVSRHFVPVSTRGALATIQYDWRSFARVPQGAIALIFGYGTALFQLRLRRLAIRHAVNMDGIEWQRQKWGRSARLWLRLNERAAATLSDELIADHPEIQRYLQRALGAVSTMIAYGVDAEAIDGALVADHPLLARYPRDSYLLVIARPEPENQIHLLLDAHAHSGRQLPLLVVGNFEANAYGRHLRECHPTVDFVGPVYDVAVLNSLRARARLYLHGHSVGGTNPSLIEAMAAGAPVVAHDNPFNRWVLGDAGGWFFHSIDDLASLLRDMPDAAQCQRVVAAARATCRARFLWPQILAGYDAVVARLLER